MASNDELHVFYLDPAMTPQHEQNVITLSIFMAIRLGTTLVFAEMLVFPPQFYIFWGLSALIDGVVIGRIMYLLEVGFVYPAAYSCAQRQTKRFCFRESSPVSAAFQGNPPKSRSKKPNAAPHHPFPSPFF
jgi:hypothetical protein